MGATFDERSRIWWSEDHRWWWDGQVWQPAEPGDQIVRPGPGPQVYRRPGTFDFRMGRREWILFAILAPIAVAAIVLWLQRL
jgi:hypothetical protein